MRKDPLQTTLCYCCRDAVCIFIQRCCFADFQHHPVQSQPCFLEMLQMSGSCFYSQFFCWFHRWEQPSSAAPSHLGAVCGSDGTCRVRRSLHVVLSCSHYCCPEVSSSVDLGGFGELQCPWAMLQSYFFCQHLNSSIDAHRSREGSW